MTSPEEWVVEALEGGKYVIDLQRGYLEKDKELDSELVLRLCYECGATYMS